MIRLILASIALAFVVTVSVPASAQSASDREAYEIARDAYVYAYPLILQEATARQATNFAEPTGILTQVPFNQFSHAREFPPADFKGVVRANVDTLYSIANVDLAEEPIVVSVPATDRYFMLPMLSLWTDVFAVPGTRTTGRNTAREFLVVGPRWQGEAPRGLEIIRSPTRLVAIGGRTQTNGVTDYDAVHKIQAGYRLTPLSAWGRGPVRAAQGQGRCVNRHEDAAAGDGRQDGCGDFLRPFRGAPEGQPAGSVRLSDDPPSGAGWFQGRRELRSQRRTPRD
jgi:hypothetical protein